MNTKYTAFIGIDISKEKLDLCLIIGDKSVGFIIGNSVTALSEAFKIDAILSKIKFSKTLFCFEHMGMYQHHLETFLKKKRANFSIQSPLHIKRSMGLVRGKTDKLDAERIALFASRNYDSLKLWEKPRDVIIRLEQLKALRRRLIGVRTIITMPLKEGARFRSAANSSLNQKGCKATLTALHEDIKWVEKEIRSQIDLDPNLNRLYKILTSVNRIGFVIAVSLIVITDEFKRFETASQLACYIGLAPFERTSGSSVKGRPRISFHANKELKSLLHLAALGGIRAGGEMRNYYERKKAEGKHSLVVINAIKNKIIKQLFTCVKEDRLFEKR